jgi:transposase
MENTGSDQDRTAPEFSNRNFAKGNRKSQDKFLCLKCGFELNADFNAAINIGARADSSEGLLCRSKGSPNDQAQAPCL